MPTERTITTFGHRLEPSAADRLPWNELEGVDAAFVTAGNPGAIREARRARVLVATSRAMPLLAEADVHLDAIVGSRSDPDERFDPEAPTLHLSFTEGAPAAATRRATALRTYPAAPRSRRRHVRRGQAAPPGCLGLAAGLGLDATRPGGSVRAWNVAGRGPGRLLAADLAGAGA
jgi:hypothetical protein